MKLTKLFGTLLIVIAFGVNAMGQIEALYNGSVEQIGNYYKITGTYVGLKINGAKEGTPISGNTGLLTYNCCGTTFQSNGTSPIYVKFENGEIKVSDSPFDSSDPEIGEEPTACGYEIVSDGSCNKLKITSSTVVIPADVELNITEITNFPKGGSFSNYGTINFINCSTGDFNDFEFVSIYKGDYSNCKVTFKNYGTIHCNDWKGEISIDCSDKLEFTNEGEIICENDFKTVWGSHHTFSQSCGSNISAKNNISIRSNESLVIIGGYSCKNMTLDFQSGKNISFGNSSCASGESKVVIKEILKLKSGVGTITFDGDASIKQIVSETWGTVNMNVNGSVIIGTVTGSIGVNTLPPSILTLCYNPTVEGKDNILNSNTNAGGKYEGKIIYRVSTDPKIESNYWTETSTPFTEKDIEGIPENMFKGNKVSFDDCMQGKQSLLGYDDDPFLPKDKEIYQLYNCNPCSKDFEDTKMEIREIHGKTFRLINGELIYCENDN